MLKKISWFTVIVECLVQNSRISNKIRELGPVQFDICNQKLNKYSSLHRLNKYFFRKILLSQGIEIIQTKVKKILN
jgi:hypothetical protein